MGLIYSKIPGLIDENTKLTTHILLHKQINGGEKSPPPVDLGLTTSPNLKIVYSEVSELSIF
jgi:hypothetical protein